MGGGGCQADGGTGGGGQGIQGSHLGGPCPVSPEWPKGKAPRAPGRQELSEASAHLAGQTQGPPRTNGLKRALSPNSPLSLEPHRGSPSLVSSCRNANSYTLSCQQVAPLRAGAPAGVRLPPLQTARPSGPGLRILQITSQKSSLLNRNSLSLVMCPFLPWLPGSSAPQSGQALLAPPPSHALWGWLCSSICLSSSRCPQPGRPPQTPQGRGVFGGIC